MSMAYFSMGTTKSKCFKYNLIFLKMKQIKQEKHFNMYIFGQRYHFGKI